MNKMLIPLRKSVFLLLRLSGLHYVFREIIQKNKVTILLFHDISKEKAIKVFEYLHKNYNIIGLNFFIEAIEKCNKKVIPPKALILTFDDGFIDNYTLLSILKKSNTPISIFLVANLIDTNRFFWFKYSGDKSFISFLKKKSNQERLKILSEIGFEQTKEFKRPQTLQKMHIDKMKDVVNFQSHTLFHPCLPKCNDGEAWNEIAISKKILEEKFNLNINAIAYPNGDYTSREISFAKKAQYRCGITVDYGFNSIETDVYRLKRISVNEAADFNEFIVKSSGLWGFLKKIFTLK